MSATIRHRALALTLLLGSLAIASPPGAPANAEVAGTSLGTGARVRAALATGSAHTCVIIGTSSLKCFGANFAGQLGYGDTSDRGGGASTIGNNLATVDVGNYAAFNQGVLLQVAAGYDHTCVILADGVAPNIGRNGRVKCWGANQGGQLGYGDGTPRGSGPNQMGESLPFVNLGTGRFAVQLAAGDRHTCALLDNGRVKCWGYAFYGQLGYGDQQSRGDGPGEMGDALPFVNLGTGRTALKISARRYQTCAVLDDASLKCWGANEHGQLGQGDTAARGDAPGEMGDNLRPIDLGRGAVVLGVAVGDHHVCASTVDGVKCWGDGSGGRLGLGSTDSRGDQPGEMGDSLPFVSLDTLANGLSAGSAHTCAQGSAIVQCWGVNGFGRLGIGNTTNQGTAPGQMGAALPAVPLPLFPQAVAAGDTHTCAVTLGTVYDLRCWGNGGSGRLGTGATATLGDQPGEVAALTAVNLGAGQSLSLRLTVPGTDNGLARPRWAGNSWVIDLSQGAADGGTPITGRRVEVSTDGGRTWSTHITTAATTVNLTSVLQGTRPLIRVRAVNAVGVGPPTFPQHPLISTSSPARLLDTRGSGRTVDGQFQATGLRPAGSTVELQITGRGPVPANATAVALNVTATGATRAGFVTVFPCGTTRPNASNLNYLAGRTVPNAVISRIGTGGRVCVYTEAPAQLIADVTGWFLPANDIVTRAPARLLDTRTSGRTIDGLAEGGGPRAAGSTLQLQVTGRAGVPSSTGTVVLNVTTSGSTAPGFITAFPCGDDRPNASNLNYVAGQTVANLVVTKVGAGGRVCLYVESATQLIADLTGYYSVDGQPPTSASPVRLLDTRPSGRTYDGNAQGQGRLAAGEVVELAIQGRAGIEAVAEVVLLNVTVSGATAAGFVTVYPCGAPRPNASNLNYAAGQAVPNLVVAKLGVGGKVCLYTESPAHLIADLSAQL